MILGEAPVTILRYPDGGQTWSTDGRPIAGVPTIIPDVLMSVQPLKQQEWQMLGLGGRISDWRKVYSETLIRSGRPEGGSGSGPTQVEFAHMPDWVVIGDFPLGEYAIFEFVQVNSYDFICPHYKGIAKRLDESSQQGAV